VAVRRLGPAEWEVLRELRLAALRDAPGEEWVLAIPAGSAAEHDR